jgi:hypothetical protein
VNSDNLRHKEHSTKILRRTPLLPRAKGIDHTMHQNYREAEQHGISIFPAIFMSAFALSFDSLGMRQVAVQLILCTRNGNRSLLPAPDLVPTSQQRSNLQRLISEPSLVSAPFHSSFPILDMIKLWLFVNCSCLLYEFPSLFGSWEAR